MAVGKKPQPDWDHLAALLNERDQVRVQIGAAADNPQVDEQRINDLQRKLWAIELKISAQE